MGNLHYEVVEHDGGWTYKLGDVFAETYRTREEAAAAAREVAEEQKLAGEDEVIEYQDANGVWKVESAPGDDRPDPDVFD